MNYELAKKLMDAGFPPFDGKHCSGCYCDETLFVPTLSELIKACGNSFIKVMKYFEEDNFLATGDKKGDIFLGDGKTPEEAVANLWLELNENHTQ